MDLVLRDLLRQRTPKEMKMSIESMPVDLQDLYNRLLNQMEGAIESQKRIGKLTIAVLLKADGPVSFTKVCGMLNMAFESQIGSEISLDTANILEACGGFVFIEPSGSRLRFIHQTAKDFLVASTHFKDVDISTWAENIPDRQALSQEAQFSPSSSKVFVPVHDSDAEETTSRDSWSSDVFSNASSTSSQSSLFSQLETVTDQFAKLFATHEDLRPIILESLDKQGIAGFEHFFSKLLREYSRELQLIAKRGAPSEQVAALMVGQRTRVIARETMIMSGYLDNVEYFPQKSQRDENPGKIAVLNRFLQEKDKGLEFEDIPTPTSEKKTPTIAEIRKEDQPLPQSFPRSDTEAEYMFDDKEEQEEEGNEEEVVEAYVNVQRVQQFLTLNAPFAKLIEQLRQRLEPRLKIPLIEDLEQDHNLLVKPAHGSLQRKMNATILAWIEAVWEFKLRPALGGEMPLEPGMKRVRWTCVSDRSCPYVRGMAQLLQVCNRGYYDDFIEIKPGAVARIQASLTEIYRREPQAIPAQSTPVWTDSRTAVINAVFVCFTLLGSYASISFPKFGQLPKIVEILLRMALVMIPACIFWVTLPPRLRMIAKLHERTDAMLTEGNSKGGFSLDTQCLRLKDIVDHSRSSSRMLGESLSNSPPAESLSLHSGIQNSERITHSSASNQDGNASHSRTTMESRLQGTDSESADLGLQRLPIGSTKDEEEDANSGQALWVMPCFRNPKGDDQVVQVRVSDRTLDGALFSRFRRQYFIVSSWWRRFVKMQEVTTIKFVMVNIHNDYAFDRYKGTGRQHVSQN